MCGHPFSLFGEDKKVELGTPGLPMGCVNKCPPRKALFHTSHGRHVVAFGDLPTFVMIRVYVLAACRLATLPEQHGEFDGDFEVTCLDPKSAQTGASHFGSRCVGVSSEFSFKCLFH